MDYTAIGLTVVMWGSGLAVATATSVPPCGATNLSTCVVGAEDDALTTQFSATGDDKGGDEKKTSGEQAKRASAQIVELRHVPTCLGNELSGDSSLCEGATTTCPDPTMIRYWQYRREYARGTAAPEFQRVYDPAFVCLGPEDPRLDPTAAIPAIVDREFQRVVVLKGIAKVSPAPDTLITVETRFSTAAPASYDIPLTILGQSVVITATASAWTWHFGDGDTQTVRDRSSRGSTIHTYARSGVRGAYVVIEWTGTYRIGGDPTERQVNGTATTTGEPVPVNVRTARTELVDQPG